ncbi:unnamed protein product [Microthlaspi erraticum]|uniref:Uncharacterized protein n=1 Tax=Microthlaspi erraticum TaxID=1685480 RepID=A0A6D2JZU9_9BRAS|nr:unnamed protein product [Microthlaspi erraticum]
MTIDTLEERYQEASPSFVHSFSSTMATFREGSRNTIKDSKETSDFSIDTVDPCLKEESSIDDLSPAELAYP